MILSLINTKLYITYFNDNAVLGCWYMVVNILNWILYFDLGIGNGLRNGIVTPMENKDYKTVKRYISTGYVVIGVISTAIVIVGTVLSLFVNWNVVLNIDTVSNTKLMIMIIISLFGIGAQFLLKVITSIYRALRKTMVSGLCALATNLILFLYLRFANADNPVDALIAFAIAYALATNIPLIAVSIWAYTRSLKEVKPSPKLYDKSASRSITSLGLKFFIIQIALLVVSSTDTWLIGFFYSTDYNVDYNTYYRFFSIALTVYAMFSQTTWSSITKYYEQHNISRIKRLYRFMNIIAVIGGSCCAVFALIFRLVVNVWMGDVATKATAPIALLFALWMFMQMLVNSSTAVANGMGRLRVQEIFVPVAGVLKILLVAILSTLGYSWECVVLSNAICLVPLILVQHISIGRELKKISKQE